MSNLSVRPGGALSARPLYFFWIVDYSGSMRGTKMGTLNNAISEVIPEMRKAAEENYNAQLFVRTMKFSDEAFWVDHTPIKIEDFSWKDIEADGLMTNMGHAFKLLAQELETLSMPERALPPVIVILSDGKPTGDYNSLNTLLNLPWGKKSVRIAIAIGDDADTKFLERFTGNSELVIRADNAPKLVNAIRWASTVASTVAKNPGSEMALVPFDNRNEVSVVNKPANKTGLPPLTLLDEGNDESKNFDVKADDVF